MIAIAGGKGGCGKTTTTLGVARALVARGVRARTVDLDVGMPNLHRLAGVRREPTLADCVGAASDRLLAAPDRAEPTADRRDVVDDRQRDAAGVEVVPAPRVTAPVDVPDALAVLRTAPGVTLLDCPASAGPDGAMPLREASAVLLVSTNRAESLEDAAKTGRMARSLDVPVVGAVVTRTDSLSERVRSTIPTDHVVPVPESDAPLDDPAIRERYGVVAEWLAETDGAASASAPRARVAAAGAEDAAGAVRSVRRGDQRTDVRRWNGQRVDAQRTDGQRTNGQGTAERRPDAHRADAQTATRRRDRRSRRSPGAAGARSSSRGGGGPSDRT